MSDRLSAWIAIGGPVSPEAAAALLEAIECDSPDVGEWDGPNFEGFETALEQCTDGNGTLDLYHNEACGGCFHEIERVCIEHGIAFDRHSDARWEYDAEIRRYRPGMESPEFSHSTQGYAQLVRADDVAAARARLMEGDAKAALEKLSEVLKAWDVPELEPFRLVEAGCTCGETPTGPMPNYCRLHDGDYSDWLVFNNVD